MKELKCISIILYRKFGGYCLVQVSLNCLYVSTSPFSDIKSPWYVILDRNARTYRERSYIHTTISRLQGLSRGYVWGQGLRLSAVSWSRAPLAHIHPSLPWNALNHRSAAGFLMAQKTLPSVPTAPFC